MQTVLESFSGCFSAFSIKGDLRWNMHVGMRCLLHVCMGGKIYLWLFGFLFGVGLLVESFCFCCDTTKALAGSRLVIHHLYYPCSHTSHCKIHCSLCCLPARGLGAFQSVSQRHIHVLFVLPTHACLNPCLSQSYQTGCV